MVRSRYPGASSCYRITATSYRIKLMYRIEIGNSPHVHSWSKFEEPNIKFGFSLKSSKKQIPMPVRPYTTISTLF
ncbi:hypothetical protein [Clostridium weizhouense]|uniref:Uncharacterized protein n=1 Tax=Clostridium weizhouense TaxID=2859781 RepID=A0ABS7ASK3_9CLOT|nr:hypothetical protein [Clostridium weizhouense]MBW6411653.1 hypothetical protein [Clostridium weizhouense]